MRTTRDLARFEHIIINVNAVGSFYVLLLNVTLRFTRRAASEIEEHLGLPCTVIIRKLRIPSYVPRTESLPTWNELEDQDESSFPIEADAMVHEGARLIRRYLRTRGGISEEGERAARRSSFVSPEHARKSAPRFAVSLRLFG